jgi:3,4-dihydroxy 2-butanone 4-phosphate synthase/GTP cyclohydrolase II
LRRIADEGRGVAVVLACDEDAATVLGKLSHSAENDAHGSSAGREQAQQEWRQLGLGAQILADLGARRLRVLGTPRKLVGLSGFGLEVTEYVE